MTLAERILIAPKHLAGPCCGVDCELCEAQAIGELVGEWLTLEDDWGVALARLADVTNRGLTTREAVELFLQEKRMDVAYEPL